MLLGGQDVKCWILFNLVSKLSLKHLSIVSAMATMINICETGHFSQLTAI